MRTFFIFVCIFLVAVSVSFAAEFSPTKLKLNAQPMIEYQFNGTELSIPVTVSGTPANLLFAVFTKDQAESIGPIRNGYLGWHFVNKIDTCMYISDMTTVGVGSNTVVWNGKDSDGMTIPKGEYTYYMWAYDNVSAKKPVTRQVPFPYSKTWATLQKYDDNGNPLNKPVIYRFTALPSGYDERGDCIHAKWIIGGDPDDATLVETSSISVFRSYTQMALDPNDHTMWYYNCQRPSAVAEVGKYKWVPNGESELQVDWGVDGYFTYQLPQREDEYMNSVAVEGDQILTLNNEFKSGLSLESELLYVDIADGTETARVDMSKWWIRVDDAEAGAQASGGPHKIINGPDGTVALSSHTTCLDQVIAPLRYGEIGDDIDTITLWVNGNGDYTGDHNFEEDADKPWVCFDFNVGPYKYISAPDANGFTMFPCYDMGAVSFGLYAPDGTGVSYHAFAGETAGVKYGEFMVDIGSSYDGIYTDNNSAEADKVGWWYIAHDSIKGVITDNVAVDESAPAAFTVAQNTPNPFNPSTTINFSLAQSGNVTVDVFNIAGQKIEAIANEFMNAGNHSVTWDASGFSAGVYFYTVKSGDFSQTLKMTLLK
ncbi:MAG: T9SS type A sorting domain-containing protein [Candidatus Latescibacteria bacterium]|nr:T9SS type A sorting domain-containing protein [Candidatus Latescibacterota bacterium]